MQTLSKSTLVINNATFHYKKKVKSEAFIVLVFNSLKQFHYLIEDTILNFAYLKLSSDFLRKQHDKKQPVFKREI